jgi:hypothetical protein
VIEKRTIWSVVFLTAIVGSLLGALGYYFFESMGMRPDDVTAWSTLSLTVATLVLGFFAYRTIQESKTLTEHPERQANATTKLADAASRQMDLLHHQEAA